MHRVDARRTRDVFVSADRYYAIASPRDRLRNCESIVDGDDRAVGGNRVCKRLLRAGNEHTSQQPEGSDREHPRVHVTSLRV
jgi:hypothetical protein